MHLAPVLSSLALTLAPSSIQELTSSPAISDVAPAHAWWETFPEASADLALGVGENGDSQTMLALVDDYAELTGQYVVLNREIRALLGAHSTGMQTEISVPKAHVQAFFEAILIENDYVLTVLRTEAPRLLGIQSLRTTDRNSMRSRARFVPHENLQAMRDHPAMLITTTVALPYVDVRQLSNSMRTMITDANTQQMLPAGSSDSLVVTDFGPATADLVAMLERINAEAKPMWERNESRRQTEEGGRGVTNREYGVSAFPPASDEGGK